MSARLRARNLAMLLALGACNSATAPVAPPPSTVYCPSDFRWYVAYDGYVERAESLQTSTYQLRLTADSAYGSGYMRVWFEGSAAGDTARALVTVLWPFTSAYEQHGDTVRFLTDRIWLGRPDALHLRSPRGIRTRSLAPDVELSLKWTPCI